MRILHTGDWHLGRVFYGRHLTEDQVYMVEHQLFPLLKEEQIDALIIAGDVFDRSIPPVEAVELWDYVLTRIAMDFKIPLFVVAGNHDGAERLELGRALMEQSQICIWGTPEHCMNPYIYEAKDGPVAICPMPYGEPRRIGAVFETMTVGNGEGTDEGIENGHDFNQVYSAWSQRLQTGIPRNMRSIAICHGFVSGGEAGGSERPLSVGGSEVISPTLFNGFSYTALGHLHGAQRMGADNIRYCGSPLTYSFDEVRQEKSFTVVDMDTAGHTGIKTVPVMPKRNVGIIEGYFEDLLNDRSLVEKYKEQYVLARLWDTVPVLDSMAKLRQRFPYCMSVELAGRMAVREPELQSPVYRHIDERQLFSQFAEAVWKEPLSEEQSEYIDELWNKIVKEE